MLSQLADLVSRVRSKASIEMSFAAHTAGRWLARQALGLDSDLTSRERAAQLEREGYVSIPPDECVARFVANDYVEMERAWSTHDGTWRDPPVGGTFKSFLSNVCERWPSSLDLLNGASASMLRSYYRSHFQFNYVEPYRTYPSEGDLAKSWLWHRDAVPPGVLKLMVYLNGATASTGALRVVDRAASRDIYRRGFGTRVDSGRFAREFEEKQLVLEGPPGTAVIIDNSVLHKATAPETGFRDVICFQIMPSTVTEPRARDHSSVSRSYAPNTPQYPLLPRLYRPVRD